MRSLPGGGYGFEGHTAAVEEGTAWAVRYQIHVDERWVTRTARIWSWTGAGAQELLLEADGQGHWRVNGEPRGDLDGCLDVDLESSACTNTFPVHRMGLAVGQVAQAPAVYVRAVGLGVVRLDQGYVRLLDGQRGESYDYRSDTFDYRGRLDFDESGLVLTYPDLATRIL